MDSMGHLTDSLTVNVKEKVMDGTLEICPCCEQLSAYAWRETNAYDGLGSIIPGGFKPAKGTIAHIGTSSGLGEWQCGHCHKHLVEADSVLNSPCYTHSED
jgi:hypothetical protein